MNVVWMRRGYVEREYETVRFFSARLCAEKKRITRRFM